MNDAVISHEPEWLPQPVDAGAARAAWRAEEEEWTTAAFARWTHGRTLVDRARDHLHRGDLLEVALDDSRVVGRVVGVGDDVIAIESEAGRVDINAGARAPVVWRVLRRETSGGSLGLDVGSFRARVLELEMDARWVDVDLDAGWPSCRGGLTVGRDHVVITDDDGGEAVIAWAAIRAVRALPVR